MNIRKKEIYNFILKSLPNKTEKEFIEEVNNKYGTSLICINNFDNLDPIDMSSYIYREVVLG